MLQPRHEDQGSQAIAVFRLSPLRRPALKADLILVGRVLVGDSDGARADAVAIRAGRIVAVGDSGDVLALREARTTMLGSPTAAVVPGFVDAHLHFVALARRATEVDCSLAAARNIAEVAGRIREAARQRPPGTWIRAFGYDECFLAERRPPMVAELDRAAPRHPVRLLHRTGHAVVLNTAAFAQLGLPAREEILEPADLLRGRTPAPEAGEMARLAAAASQRLLSAGVTCFHDLTPGQDAAALDVWKRWIGDRTVRQRVVVYGEVLESRNGEAEEQPARLRYAGAKIVVTEATDAGELSEAVTAADRAGAQVALHAVEGGPLVMAVAALRRLGRERVRSRRHRIEHAALCPPALVDELAACGAIVVTHPAFLESFAVKYRAEVHAHEQEWLYPVRDLRAARVPVAFGSDAPIADPRPLANLQAAVTRGSPAEAPLGRAQSIPVAEALELHTLGGAAAGGLDPHLGRVVPGAIADLVLLDDDPTAVPPSEVAAIGVRATVVGGEVAWSR